MVGRHGTPARIDAFGTDANPEQSCKGRSPPQGTVVHGQRRRARYAGAVACRGRVDRGRGGASSPSGAGLKTRRVSMGGYRFRVRFVGLCGGKEGRKKLGGGASRTHKEYKIETKDFSTNRTRPFLFLVRMARSPACPAADCCLVQHAYPHPVPISGDKPAAQCQPTYTAAKTRSGL